MLRIAARSNIASRQHKFVRQYSEGFDLSKYLNRIEAISKTKPSPRQTKPQTRQHPQAKAADNAQNKTARTSSNNAGQARERRLNYQQQPRKARSAVGAKPPAKEAPASANAGESFAAKKSEARPVKSAEASASSATPGSKWGALDVTEKSRKPSARRAPRRHNFLKAGPKSKAGSKSKDAVRRHSNRSAAASTPTQTAKLTTKHSPSLKPSEALEVIYRNEGTSAGGFIAPPDVSLSGSQPYFVESSISYESRVRSLLNSISQTSSAQDKEQLERLVNKYVRGSYIELEGGKTLTSQSSASELNANQTVTSHQKEFFVQVASGKISPKQIAAGP